MYNNPNLVLSNEQRQAITPNTVRWQSPSNIALVKYWGKFGIQYPCNASISFTLNHAYTQTELTYTKKPNTSNSQDQAVSLQFTFEGKAKPSFAQKIEKFLQSIFPIFPFLSQLHLSINSQNSFPHSSGIASSASAMSALALCLCDIEQQLFNTLSEQTAFLQKASYVARLGSGSACRSVYPTAAVWGESAVVSGSTNHYAVPYTSKLHPVFTNYYDSILIVSKEEKKVSSRAGHALMNNNPFAETRYQQANNNLAKLLTAMQQGNLSDFINIVEKEALSLHALMMMSEPSFILIRPNTLAIIEAIQSFRAKTNTPVCFTLDAGPNVHILYPDSHQRTVKTFITNELAPLTENNYIIHDVVGQGAQKLG